METASKIRLHVGMRNIKTALAVFACLMIYHFWGRDSYMLAAISAIICMQDTVEKSVSSGLNRCAGTAIGAALGTGLLYLRELSPFDGMVLFATLGTILLIALCNAINKQDAIVIGCVVFLTVVLGQTEQTPIVYGINRLLDTFLGILIAILINRFIRNPDKRVQEPDSEPQPNLPFSPEDTENRGDSGKA